MAKLYNFKSAYSMVQTLYGIEPDPNTFEDVALVAWDKINNKHTRLYRYVADTKDKELQLPCNVSVIESVHIPITDATITSNKDDYVNMNSVWTEHYIDAWPSLNNPFNTKGKLVKYKEGDGVLYFDRDFKNVMVVYHGILCDEEDGLPLINDKEMKAIASFVAWREMLKDLLRKGTTSKYAFALVQTVEAEWLKHCNAARLPEHISQNEMDAILDVKYRWDRKSYGKSLKPIL